MVQMKIKRQMHPQGSAYWELFEVRGTHDMTVFEALSKLNQRPITVYGVAVAPIVWETVANLEGRDAPLMIINGDVAVPQAKRVKDLTWPISVEPLNTFPVLRDLLVDKTHIHGRLKQSGSARPFDGFGDLHTEFLLREISVAADMAACTHCGACLEYSQALYIALSSVSGTKPSQDFFSSLMRRGGVLDVENISAGEDICPHKVPLSHVVKNLRHKTFRHFLSRLFF